MYLSHHQNYKKLETLILARMILTLLNRAAIKHERRCHNALRKLMPTLTFAFKKAALNRMLLLLERHLEFSKLNLQSHKVLVS